MTESNQWPTSLDETGQAPTLMECFESSSAKVAGHATFLVDVAGALQEKGWKMEVFQFPMETSGGGITLPCMAWNPEEEAVVLTAFFGEWDEEDIKQHEDWMKKTELTPDLAHAKFLLVVNSKPPKSIAKLFEVMEMDS